MCDGNQEFKLQMFDKYVEKALGYPCKTKVYGKLSVWRYKYYSYENINGI